MSTKVPPPRLFKSAAERLNTKAERYLAGEKFSVKLTRFERWRLRGYALNVGDVIGIVQTLVDRTNVTITDVKPVVMVLDTKGRPLRQVSVEIIAIRPVK